MEELAKTFLMFKEKLSETADEKKIHEIHILIRKKLLTAGITCKIKDIKLAWKYLVANATTKRNK